jgi:hypothetical protein
VAKRRSKRKKTSLAELGCWGLLMLIGIGWISNLLSHIWVILFIVAGVLLWLWSLRFNSAQKKLDLESYQELQGISLMDPIDFEKLIGQLFEDMGYAVRTTAVTGDEGIDLFLQKDGVKEVVQCKRFKGNVGAPIVRDLYGAMIHFNAQKSYLVTTGRITQPAREWVAGKPIELIDGAELMRWIGRIRAARTVTNVNKSSYKIHPLLAASVFTFGLGCAYLISGDNSPVANPTEPTTASVANAYVLPTRTPRTKPTSQTQAILTKVALQPSSTISTSSTLEPTKTPQASHTSSIEPTQIESIVYYVTGTKKINARSCPRLDCKIVAVFEPGTTISAFETVQGENFSGSNDWRHFTYEGESAYIHSAFTSLKSKTE